MLMNTYFQKMLPFHGRSSPLLLIAGPEELVHQTSGFLAKLREPVGFVRLLWFDFPFTRRRELAGEKPPFLLCVREQRCMIWPRLDFLVRFHEVFFLQVRMGRLCRCCLFECKRGHRSIVRCFGRSIRLRTWARRS